MELVPAILFVVEGQSWIVIDAADFGVSAERVFVRGLVDDILAKESPVADVEASK